VHAVDVITPDTPFMRAVREIIAVMDGMIPPTFTGTVDAFLVGGAAVHIYTGWRVSDGLDLKLSHRVLMPRAPSALYIDDDGREKGVRLDTAYSDVIALLPPDWERGSLEVEKIGRIRVRVIAPVDLAVSKIGRFQGHDADDIEQLARHGLLDADDVEGRCAEALDCFIGGTDMIRYNLRDALEIIRTCSPTRP